MPRKPTAIGRSVRTGGPCVVVGAALLFSVLCVLLLAALRAHEPQREELRASRARVERKQRCSCRQRGGDARVPEHGATVVHFNLEKDAYAFSSTVYCDRTGRPVHAMRADGDDDAPMLRTIDWAPDMRVLSQTERPIGPCFPRLTQRSDPPWLWPPDRPRWWSPADPTDTTARAPWLGSGISAESWAERWNSRLATEDE